MARKRKADGFDYSLTVTKFERSSWRVERIGWMLTLLLLAVALAGGLGSGPLSRASAGGAELRVEFDRVARAHPPAPLATRTTPLSAVLAVVLDSTLLALMGDPAFLPAPRAMRATSAGLLAEWDVTAGDAITLLVPLQLPAMGWQVPRVRLSGGEWIRLPMLILP